MRDERAALRLYHFGGITGLSAITLLIVSLRLRS
jgi:hypothetical protein